MHSFIDLLHTKGVHVYLVSGGFRQVVCICTVCACAFMSYPFYGIQIQLITYTNTYICIYIYTHTDDQPRRRNFEYPFSQNLREQSALQCMYVCMCFLVFIYENPFVSYVFTYQWMDGCIGMYVWVYESI